MKKSTIQILAHLTAFCVPLILIVPFILRLFADWRFTPEQYLSYSIGMAGPLAALAGYLFVYLSFLHQSEQFEFDKNERVFAQYLSNYQDCVNNLQFTSLYRIGWKGPDPIRERKTENGNRVFEFFVSRIQEWIIFDWHLEDPTSFKENTGIDFIPRRNDFSLENVSKEEAKMLITAVSNEKAFGQYFTILKFLFSHSKSSNFKDFIGVFESLISYEEKVFLYHYCPVMLENDLVDYLKENKFLQSFSKKHWKRFFGKSFW